MPQRLSLFSVSRRLLPLRFFSLFLVLLFLLFPFSACAPQDTDPMPWARETLVFTASFSEGGEAYRFRFSLPAVGEAGDATAVLLSPMAATGLSYIERNGACYAKMDDTELPLASTPAPLVCLSAMRPSDASLLDVEVTDGIRQVTLLSEEARYIYLYAGDAVHPYEVRRIGDSGYLALTDIVFE